MQVIHDLLGSLPERMVQKGRQKGSIAWLTRFHASVASVMRCLTEREMRKFSQQKWYADTQGKILQLAMVPMSWNGWALVQYWVQGESNQVVDVTSMTEKYLGVDCL